MFTRCLQTDDTQDLSDEVEMELAAKVAIEFYLAL